jgi:transcription elongation factor Elf1
MNKIKINLPNKDEYFKSFPHPCPICNSSNVLFKKKISGYWCRRCGASFQIIEKNKEVYVIEDSNIKV